MKQGNKKTALIVGMARSGIASAKLLYRHGWNVVINDMKREIPGLQAALEGISYTDRLGLDPGTLLDGVDLMVLSPVVPIFQPFAKEAKRRGIEVIGEIELGYRYCDPTCDFVCISGTNGKTTTTTLTGEIFKASGKPTFVLGNIGIPISACADETKPHDTIVAEVAALQLESIQRFHARAAGMLNITEDHLNRFENSMQNYIAAKCRIFENQTPADFAALNYDDPIVRDMKGLTKAKVVYFSQKTELEEGAFLRDDEIVWRYNGEQIKILTVPELRIPGAHNVENALCSTVLSLCMGIAPQVVRSTLKAFPGVEHRIEFVLERDGIQYVNDSKGTNPDSTIKAVQAMRRPTILLLGAGNYDKGSDFLPLFESFSNIIKGVVCSGCNVPAILDAAKRANFKNIAVCDGSFREMIEMARDMAAPGYTVLLSPAAASWGMFEDYEQRGREFKKIVRGLD